MTVQLQSVSGLRLLLMISFQSHYAMGLALKECGKVNFAEDAYSRSIQEFITSYKMSNKKNHESILDAIAIAVDQGNV